ncbi:Hypothetical protein CINCED_3A008605 [Cinara cedri]|uniref:Uncharacterized protein n=1 Tax=Cinara cedri TaxID=506608 RepID=A0A5E4N9A5_9HEMI|nr:Hypothetical protein CINCED_3A008605 [Cinara cedri]
MSGLTGNNLLPRCTSWLCTTCENARFGVRKSPISQSISNSLDADYLLKINNILLTVIEMKKSVFKYESLFSKLKNKLDKVSNQLLDLGGRSLVLENRVTQLENRLSSKTLTRMCL